MGAPTTKERRKSRKGVPRELIYEMRYGKPIYYRDYDKVLSGEKSFSFTELWMRKGIQ